MKEAEAPVLYISHTGIIDLARKNYKNRRCLLNVYTPEEIADWRRVDLYFVLHLDAWKDEPIPESLLKTQLKRMTMKYHPDINKRSSTNVFLLINTAYDILSDPVKRQKYDSFILDESIPSVSDFTRETFFDVFGPVFLRNAAFSSNQPAPKLGNMDSEGKEVVNFYKFWRAFDSNRSFEFFFVDPRFKDMVGWEKKQEKAQVKSRIKKKAIEDARRISMMVELAYKHDPRIPKRTLSKDLPSKESIDGWSSIEIQIFDDIIKSSKPQIENDDWQYLFDKFALQCRKPISFDEFVSKGRDIIRTNFVKKQPVSKNAMRKRRIK